VGCTDVKGSESEEAEICVLVGFFPLLYVRAGRSDHTDGGKCFRLAWINMLRQDTEILPLAVSPFLNPSYY